jgi:hypothetical protein
MTAETKFAEQVEQRGQCRRNQQAIIEVVAQKMERIPEPRLPPESVGRVK